MTPPRFRESLCEADEPFVARQASEQEVVVDEGDERLSSSWQVFIPLLELLGFPIQEHVCSTTQPQVHLSIKDRRYRQL